MSARVLGAGGGGCFRRGAQVQLEGGRTIAIEDLRVGDEVLAFDEQGVIQRAKVTQVHCHEDPQPILRVKFWRGETCITPNHWVLNQYGSFAEIGRLTTHDALVDGMGHLRPIVDAEVIGHEPVYNLTVEPHHTFICDGIRVHNGGHRERFPVVGAGGGGGDKGGGRSAQEDPDTLQSIAYARVLDLVCEGEVEGLRDGLGSIYLDDTPIQNADGSYNFANVSVVVQNGTQQQSHVPGYSFVESETAVAVKVTNAVPVVRTISDVNVTSCRVTVSVPALISQDTSNGDIHGSSVQLAIDVMPSGGAWTEMKTDTISGKTRSRYQRSYRIVLTGSAPWSIRVRRITADSGSSAVQNELWWETLTQIYDYKLTYPNSALVGIDIDAKQFRSIPRRNYHMRLLRVQVPTNYDPVARTYTGIWDGTFKVAWTNNPAWCFYDLVTNPRYGLGDRVSPSQVDKWALYTIGQYCDEMVPSGFTDGTPVPNMGLIGGSLQTLNGTYPGMEPRFTLNVLFQQRAEAYKVLADLASVFRGMVYWMNGMVAFTQDAPADPVMQYSPANVIGGTFTYAGSSRTNRHTVALVTWNDPAERFKQKIEYVEDPEGIARYGIRQTEIIAFGCTSRGQAHRAGKWLLLTERIESDLISFKVGLDSAFVKPGDVIQVADPYRAGVRMGGRVLSATTTSVTVDAAVTLEAGKTYTLTLMMPDGTMQERTLSNVAGQTTNLTFASPLTTAPLVGSVWVLAANDLTPQLARVVLVREVAKNEFEINAIAHNPSKYAAVEQGLVLEPQRTSILTSSAVPTVTGLQLAELSYRPVAGGGVKSTIQVSWDQLQSPSIRGYVVKAQYNSQTKTYPETIQPYFDIENAVPAVYEVSVHAVNGLGVAGPAATATIVVTGIDTRKPGDVQGFTGVIDTNVGVRLGWSGNTDPDIDFYEIRQGTVWESATFLDRVKATGYAVGVKGTGAITYLIKAIDTSGNYSQNAASAVVTVAAPNAPSIAATIEYTDLILTWNPVSSVQAIREYEVRYGATWEGGTLVGAVKGTRFARAVDFGGSRNFWVCAIDIGGNYGTPGMVEVNITAPAAPVITQQVIDNNVLLRWSDATQTLPIDRYEVRKGASWAAGTLIGTIYSRFATFFEETSGAYTYWVAAIDSAGNVGVAGSVTAQVAQPPDYLLKYNLDSAFSGTKSGMFLDRGLWYAPVNATETFEQHFTSRTWTTPQDQVNAGYPSYFQPSLNSAYYEETIDYGTVLPATTITATITYATVSGSVTVTPTISYRRLATDPWTDAAAGQASVLASNFQYVKVRYDFTASGGDDLIAISGLNIKLAVKQKTDSGSGVANAGDTGGTTVTFNVPFIDVDSIQVSPQGTSAVIPVYDFTDTPYPTSFKVLLFDKNGNRVSGPFSWVVRGI